jgi:hypothetical protein
VEIFVGRADFQDAACSGGACEHEEKFAGVASDIEHAPRAIGRGGVMRGAECLELSLDRFKRNIHVSAPVNRAAYP